MAVFFLVFLEHRNCYCGFPTTYQVLFQLLSNYLIAELYKCQIVSPDQPHFIQGCVIQIRPNIGVAHCC